jgi:hypothetical protein
MESYSELPELAARPNVTVVAADRARCRTGSGPGEVMERIREFFYSESSAPAPPRMTTALRASRARTAEP